MGGDIYIHGGHASIGCIAIGDAAIERVFTLVALAKPDSRNILICPVDFRRGSKVPITDPKITALYRKLAIELRAYTG